MRGFFRFWRIFGAASERQGAALLFFWNGLDKFATCRDNRRGMEGRRIKRKIFPMDFMQNAKMLKILRNTLPKIFLKKRMRMLK